MNEVSYVFLEKLISTAKENYPRINTFKSKASMAKTKEALKLVNYEEDEYNLTLETQVKLRYFTYVQQLITLRLQTKVYLDVQSINKNIQNKYSKGEVQFTDYLQAQMALSSAMQGKVSAEASFLTSKALLEELLTKKIEEIQ